MVVLESRVRAYSRVWPTTFDRASGTEVTDVHGKRYLDLFMGASSLNYGHNPPELVYEMTKYLASGRIINSLDAYTVARTEFLSTFHDQILVPRGLDYRLQFTGPTGTSAIEAAIRLARIVTGRSRVVHLSGAYHGSTLDAARAGDSPGRGLPVEFEPNTRFPHEYDVTSSSDSLESALNGGGDRAAAFIVEVVQGEGGVRPTSAQRLHQIQEASKRAGALFIVDDIQAGCGRVGSFFSFEQVGISPDLVCLSKSLSGIGLPLSVVLMRPELDQWHPGEYSGTFRGNNLALATATRAITQWWADDSFEQSVRVKAAEFRRLLSSALVAFRSLGELRAHGMMIGIPCASTRHAGLVQSEAFAEGLLVETCGRVADVVKLLPPLTITEAHMGEAIAMLTTVFNRVADRHGLGDEPQQ